MKRFKTQDLLNLQNKGLIKNINVPARGSKAIVIPKPDCQQVQDMHWDLKIFCEENSLILKKEYRFHETRLWRFDFAIPALKIGIEYNGLMSQKSRHTTITGYSGDMEKINEAQKAGWTILQYTILNHKNVLQDLKQILTK